METERKEARKKLSRSLSAPSPDLVGAPDVTLQEWGALHDQHLGQHSGGDHGNSDQPREFGPTNSNRFSPLACVAVCLPQCHNVGRKRSRVGEARNPSPDGTQADSIAPTQWESGAQFSPWSWPSVGDSDQGGDAQISRRSLRLSWNPSLANQRSEWHPEARWRVCSTRWHSGLGVFHTGPKSPESSDRCAGPGGADSTPALDWSIMATGRITEPVGLFEGRMSARDAVRTGWLALHEVFREWGIEEHNI